MQRQKFDILAGLNILGTWGLERDNDMLLSSIALTSCPRTERLPMSARGWNDQFRLSN
jgi:hypothetical protein